MAGVEDHGASSPMSPWSVDSDHKQLMEDEFEFIEKKNLSIEKKTLRKMTIVKRMLINMPKIV